MSDEKATEAAAKPGAKKMVLIIVILVGALVGGGAGAVFAGPVLAEMILGAESAPGAEAEASAPEEHGEHAEESDGHGAAGGATYLVENLVLNPAESNGTRFLMASVAFDLAEEAAAAEMEGRDAQVRDALLTVLGHKSVAELTDITARDSLKSELKAAISGMLPEGAIHGIYLPQFVIQ